MSSTITSQAGSILGNSLAGPMGSAIGYGVGAALGQEYDQQRLGKNKRVPIIGKLSDLSIQTSTYGRMIPIIYGKAKIAGNIIWASNIKEERRDYYQRRSKFGGKSLASTEYSYSVSLAIAIAEGEIDEILRVWLNDQLIDPRKSCYRFYNGSEDQMPDPLIEANCGHGKTPAFRGLSYIVIEDLQLGEFGNQIPNFLFEVRRKLKIQDLSTEIALEERIKAMIMIPGSGEFVYDTQVQSKVPKNYNPKYGNFNFQKTKINQNNRENKADCLVALDQLKDTCPNLQWVAPVVGWFVTNTNAGNCRILPGVEYNESSTLPDAWQVAHYNRENAHLISKNQFSGPIYGGTTNDLSILRYLDSLKNYGYKIMFYPMIFVDQHHKPWRGRITGTPEEVKQFFYAPDGYINFILHYAGLVKNKVNAFVIGSELIGLTKVRDENNNFPAVEALIDLAKKVKEIVGDKVKVTYAADWSEYHHADYGWYNLDPLWASDYIDFIGIDAYFPLTNATQPFYEEEKIIEGWSSGEGYNYYYEDSQKTIKKPLSAPYAWKNIEYWWSNEHYNPNGNKSPWVPKSKKIWFTEIGFPSVELASNQPNVFYSPDSCESNFPIHSSGRVDFVAQRQALSATEKFWRNSEFLEQMFVWTWDARPYPFWPDLSLIWSDGGCWSRGHWVNGKLGLITLQAVIQDLCLKAGLELNQINAKELCDLIDGLVINSKEDVASIINLLKTCYFFETCEASGILTFKKKINSNVIGIKQEQLVINNSLKKEPLTITKTCELQVPKAVHINYLNYLFDYQVALESAYNLCTNSRQQMNLHLPIIIDPSRAKTIAQITLQEMWNEQITYEFNLGPEYINICPNDVILLENNNGEVLPMRVQKSILCQSRITNITAVHSNLNIYKYQEKQEFKQEGILLNKENFDPGQTELIILNIPPLPFELPPYGLYLGVVANEEHWRGAEVVCPDNSALYFKHRAILGLIDEDLGESISLSMINGELESKLEEELERFANLAIINGEIVQFAKAQYLGEHKYMLSELKRNLFNTQSKQQDNKFILLDKNLQKLPLSDFQIGKNQEFLVTSIGHNLDQTLKYQFIYEK
ncbi:MAG: glycoside hydrolase TIM-barrel-like domain-containing protein [Rickettsiales bacterium]